MTHVLLSAPHCSESRASTEGVNLSLFVLIRIVRVLNHLVPLSLTLERQSQAVLCQLSLHAKCLFDNAARMPRPG